jgi:hypothetical protein
MDAHVTRQADSRLPPKLECSTPTDRATYQLHQPLRWSSGFRLPLDFALFFRGPFGVTLTAMRRAGFRLLIVPAAAVLLGAASGGSDGRPANDAPSLVALLTRVGERVERYYGRAQSIVSEETVRLEPLGHDLLWDGTHVRRLVYELRVAWGPTTDGKAPEASVLRQLVSVNGRPAREGDEPGCMDPKPVSPEPLAMLLPGRQSDYRFTHAGTRRTRGASTVMLDFKSMNPGPPDIQWKGECVSVDLPGRWRGRVWLDEATGDVVRLDEQLIGMFDLPAPKEHVRRGSASSMTIERVNSSIQYRAVAFEDPHETLMLPESIVTLQVVRDSGSPRLRIMQTFSKYRRFVTDARIVEDTEPR